MARTHHTRAQLKVRMLRALSGLSQEEFERETQVDNIAGMEKGTHHPTAAQIARMCITLKITPEQCEALLQDYEARVARHGAAASLPGPERREMAPPAAPSLEATIDEYEERISRSGEGRDAARNAERERARESWGRLSRLESFDEMVLLARTAREYQTWAVVELLCDESARAGDVERARDLAALAVEIAGRIGAPEGWRRRVLAFAMAHLASAQAAAGDLEAARGGFEEAERLWDSGEDPESVLDSGRFLDLVEALPEAR
jgi:transcriptional regulator with XRE-family HTH domain